LGIANEAILRDISPQTRHHDAEFTSAAPDTPPVSPQERAQHRQKLMTEKAARLWAVTPLVCTHATYHLHQHQFQLKLQYDLKAGLRPARSPKKTPPSAEDRG
jgi:hypothetical protein